MYKLISSIVLIIVALGLTFTFTRTRYSQYQDTKKEIELYDKALSQADELSRLRKELLAGLENISADDRERLEKFLPRNIDTVRLTIEISNLAEAAGLELNDFSFTEGEVQPETDDFITDASQSNFDTDTGIDTPNAITGTSYSLVDMDFEVSGNYEQFKDFISTVEDNLRLSDVRSIDIATPDEDGITTYTIVLRTYWLGT